MGSSCCACVCLLALASLAKSRTRTASPSHGANALTPQVDGPHSAPSQHYDEYPVSMVVGAGIGMTPAAASIRAVIKHRCGLQRRCMRRARGHVHVLGYGRAAGGKRVSRPTASTFTGCAATPRLLPSNGLSPN